MKKTQTQKTYEYYRRKLLKEAERGGLTAQEEKLLKIVDVEPSKLTLKEEGKRASKVKAEFKRIRQTKKYKAERKLRNQFYKELKKYEDYELLREARLRLQNLPPSPDQLQSAYFKNLSYKKLKEDGLTRRVDNKVVRFKGVEAVSMQIESLRKGSDPEYKKRVFIKTYKEQLELNGVPEEYITEEYNEATGEYIEIVRHPVDEMITYLESLEPKKISFLLDTGQLHDITFYYIWDDSDTESFLARLDYLTGNAEKIESQYQEAYENEFKMAKIIKRERQLKYRTKREINGKIKGVQL